MACGTSRPVPKGLHALWARPRWPEPRAAATADKEQEDGDQAKEPAEARA